MIVVVEEVPAEATYALRHAVLRPHLPLDGVALAGDDDPETHTFAALDQVSREVVSTASVRPAHCPEQLIAVLDASSRALPQWRLRGMATKDHLRGLGLGREVLDAVLDHVGAKGGGLLWCNARIGAVAFYERAGLVSVGEPWVEPEIGPHIVMWRLVG